GFLEQPIHRPCDCSGRVSKHCNYEHLSCRKLKESSCRTRPRAAYIFVIFIPSLAPRGSFALILGMRVLVVEDEKKLGSFLRNGLAQENLVVDLVHDGGTALTQILTQAYDAIVRI